jgi:imidazolonepropionase-like amidohydrolase
MKKTYFLYFVLFCVNYALAQDYFPTNEGVKSKNTNYTAFVNAKIYTNPDNVIKKGTLLIHDNKVINSGRNINIPSNAVVIDLKGKTIYPSFIDLYSKFGIAKAERPKSTSTSPQYEANREGYYWNDHVRPEQNAVAHFSFDKKALDPLIKAGFGLVNTHLQDGIVRGTGTLVALDQHSTDAKRILSDRSSQYLSFSKSVKSHQAYPSSIMGAMALLRQLYHDTNWYASGNMNTSDLSLKAFNDNSNLPQIIAAESRVNAVRADRVGDEFGVQYIILGGGDEYERIKDVKATNATFILPINFPKPYDVENTFLTNSLELEAMKEWNQRPTNPSVLDANGVQFALTLHDLKSPDKFMPNLLKAIQYGLDKTTALKALTTVPSQVLRNPKIGNLNNGSYANFLITSGDLFESKTIIYENWVNGTKNIINDIDKKSINGDYNFQLEGDQYKLSISGDTNKPKAEILLDSLKLKTKIKYDNNWIQLTFTAKDTSSQKFNRLRANVSTQKIELASVVTPDGTTVKVDILKSDNTSKKSKSDKEKKKDSPVILPVTYPNGAYGSLELPKQETILFKNATVWTNEKEGVLTQTDVLVKNGKVERIGQGISNKNAKVIEATGKHLTSGIIDEHSHIAAASINESGQNSSAEVSIEDVVDADDVDIYRNLAGGVTTIQILHGSANPIGGRSAIIKLKWGATANELVYKDAPKFIKFALGENVKQSNWGSYSRFPQTRMGVEQVYMDYFSRAKAYDTKKKSGVAYRKDVEMEVLAEILNKERFISCHSYIQSEINMLMKVAERFDFNVNTFTHILEGYKLADKMKEHGVGASTFSDWWAYKYEVNDAIPYNASILNSVGVITAINSDDAEMSRRLNQEAAKAIKYGGTSEEDAWKMVTLNPAKLLHIDDRVGSIKVGKDADLVLWNTHPMSIYAKAEKTIIEGRTFFDLELDKKLRQNIKNDRSLLINMMLKEKNKGMSTQPVKKTHKPDLHCDSVDYNQL